MVEEENELGDSRFFVYNAGGLLVEKTDRNDRTTEYEFDNLYRLTEERWLDSTPSVIHTIQFEYDAAGQMVAATDVTDGTDYDYSYDELGRIDQIDVDNGGPVLTFVPTYDLNGRCPGPSKVAPRGWPETRREE